jgi:hypothetical protein
MTAMWGGGGLYQTWTNVLDAWSTGEPADLGTLPRLDQSDFTGESWVRLTDRLTGAISRRLQTWADVLNRTMATAGDEFEVARALADARAGLLPVRALAGHPALPAELAQRLLDLVDDQIRKVQRTLEGEVQRLSREGAPRDLVERRLRTIRDNSLCVVAGQPLGGHGPGVQLDAWYVDPSASGRRRVVRPPAAPDR